MNTEGIENLQVTLASQVVQKNALISAVDLVCLCYWAESVSSQTEVCYSEVMNYFVFTSYI